MGDFEVATSSMDLLLPAATVNPYTRTLMGLLTFFCLQQTQETGWWDWRTVCATARQQASSTLWGAAPVQTALGAKATGFKILGKTVLRHTCSASTWCPDCGLWWY